MAEARWSIGKAKVEPFVGLTKSGWVRNAFDDASLEQVDDFTATAAAGLSLFQRVGRDSILSLWGLPEYTWWADLEERRRLNGRYGIGWYADFSRLNLELEGTRDEVQGQLTPEVRELTSQRTERARVSAVIALYKSLALRLSASGTDFENLIARGDLGVRSPFDRLNRREEVFQLSLLMRVRDSFDIEVGTFQVNTDFDPSSETGTGAPQPRLDNDGAGLFAQASSQRDRIDWIVRLEQQDLAASSAFGTPDSSSFPGLNEMFGEAAVSLRSRSKQHSYGLYARRDLFYALGANFAYTIHESTGAWLTLGLGSTTKLRFAGEAGTLDFTPRVGALVSRQDDLTTLSATLIQELPFGIDLEIGVLDRTVDTQASTVLDRRSTTTLTLGISLRSVSWP
jgi:hypothetical protein